MKVATKVSPSREWMSDWCQVSSFLCVSWWKQITFWWNDGDDIHFLLDPGVQNDFFKLKVVVRKVLVLSDFNQLSIITLYLFNCLALHNCEKIWHKAGSEDFGALKGIWCLKKSLLQLKSFTWWFHWFLARLWWRKKVELLSSLRRQHLGRLSFLSESISQKLSKVSIWNLEYLFTLKRGTNYNKADDPVICISRVICPCFDIGQCT